MENNIEVPKENTAKHIKRNEYGLIEDKKYVFDDNGLVDWRKMINPLYLVPNKQVFDRKGKKVPDTIEGLEDRELLILLGGLKELAQIRGFNSVTYPVLSASDGNVTVVCQIIWIPNYETEGRTVTFSAIGDATPKNTNSFGKDYLGPIAENRAFVRAVRNFLKINIVSQEEVNGNSVPNDSDNESVRKLRETMLQHGVTFDMIKSKLVQEKVDKAETFSSIEDIPKFKQFELTERIKAKAANKTTS